MRYRAVVLALLALGCAADVESAYPGERPAIEMFPDEIEISLAEWSSTLPLGAECDAAGLRVLWGTADQLERICGFAADDFRACLHDSRLIVIDMSDEPTAADEAFIIAHEAMHWLSRCSGRFTGPRQDHSDPIIWDEDGILGRVMARLGID